MKNLMDMETHAKLTRHMKEAMDWEDIMPQLVANVNGSIVVVGLGVGKEELAMAVRLTVAELAPLEMIYISDSYQYMSNAMEESKEEALARFLNEPYVPLRERFEAGDPDVFEAMILHRYNGLKVEFKIMPYDKKRREWLPEPDTRHGEVDGAVANALKDGWWEGMARSHDR